MMIRALGTSLAQTFLVLAVPGLAFAASTSQNLAPAGQNGSGNGPVISKPVITSSPVSAPVAAAPATKVKPLPKGAMKTAEKSAEKKPLSAAKKMGDKAAQAKASEVELKTQMDKLITMMTGLEVKLSSIESKMDGVTPPDSDSIKEASNSLSKDVVNAPVTTEPSSDQNFETMRAAPADVAAVKPVGSVSNSTSDSVREASGKALEGRHRSFDNGFWTFDAGGYTLRCQTVCPALMMLDDSKPLNVNAASGAIEFQTQVGPRVCQVQRCEAVR